MEKTCLLEMKGIHKRFSGVKALEDVTFTLEKGEIRALIGENGAGKSTLMKILSGAYQKDEGEIRMDGELVSITDSKNAKDLGIAVIYQEFMLAPDLSVAENIFIDQLSTGKMFINWKELNGKAKDLLEKLGFSDINPKEKVGELSVAYQQVVEICKALTRKVKVLVLDEPTAVLTFKEIKNLFQVIRKIQKEGTGVVYISHRLEEIFELSDNITVLKDGRNVDTVATGSINKETLVTMMVGRELAQLFPERNATIGKEVLRVEKLNAGKNVQDVSFNVKAGEVLGFCGLVGAGRTETMRVLFGADKKESGEVIYLGKTVDFTHPKVSVDNGLGFLPEDRKEQGLLINQSIRINTTLASLKKFTAGVGIINSIKEKKFVEKVLKTISTRYACMENDVSSLSGGNQQKVALAKWIAADCKCIIFDEPTRGVDVGAKSEIYQIINQLAEKGVAVVFISSEMLELIGMCDRVMVMRQGKITGELQADEMNEDVMINLAMGV